MSFFVIVAAPTQNLTAICANITNMTIDWDNILGDTCQSYGGEPIGDGCFPPHYVPDVFFLSILLFLGTFGVAVVLKDIRGTSIFPSFARVLISDFAVLLSIIIFVVIDIVMDLPTPKLLVPDKFQVQSCALLN